MKELKSLMIAIVVLSAIFIISHHLILFIGLGDIPALILYVLPISVFIAYSTNETRAAMMRAAFIIFSTFTSVVLAAAGIVLFIS